MGRQRRLLKRAPKAPETWGAMGVSLKLPRGYEDSEYVLSFEIGQRESGFYRELTDRVTEPSSTLLVYRYEKNNDDIDCFCQAQSKNLKTYEKKIQSKNAVLSSNICIDRYL